MSRCLCEQCRPASPGPTWTRAHAVACELRLAMDMSLAQRRGYLDLVEKARGRAGREALEARLLAAWAARRS